MTKPIRNSQRLTIAALFAALALLAAPAAALAGAEGGVSPDDPGLVDLVPKRSTILTIAGAELARNVRERRGDNIPRYDFGKGPITPYSIHDQWCVAFGSWVWNQSGFQDYLGTRFLRTAFGGSLVAIQVADLAGWAKRTGHWTLRANPGDLITYGKNHTGIVTNVDRRGRAVSAIEGNKSDAVSRVIVQMSRVTGYVSPTLVKASLTVARSSALADVG